jgi:hypothetical protein
MLEKTTNQLVAEWRKDKPAPAKAQPSERGKAV